MLAKLKLFFTIGLILFSMGFLHYTLPQHDIVRVTGTEILRKDFSGWTRIFYTKADSGGTEAVNRDLRLINTVRPNGNVSVYRNEDTGLGWPPYFKLDSSNLQAEAEDAISNRKEPQWYIIRHYGWRSPFLSIYPNAVSVKEAAGPDVRLIPWFNIVFISFLATFLWAIYVRIRRIWNQKVEPMLDNIDAAADETKTKIVGWFKRM